MRYRVLPYKQGSKSAKALAEALGGKVLKLEGSTYIYRDGDVLINWGSSNTGMFTNIQNFGCVVNHVSNKLFFFEKMKETGLTPQFWTNSEEIPDEAFPIVARTVLNGHSGNGIVIADTRADLVPAQLYVQYVKKKEEYRIHVGKTSEGTTTIAAQRKARRLSTPDDEVNWQVRNLAGGFVFTREGFTVPSACEEAAHRCLRETGLDFGAVDVVWDEQKEKAYVLEVNTAPGLEGTTVSDYANYFRNFR